MRFSRFFQIMCGFVEPMGVFRASGILLGFLPGSSRWAMEDPPPEELLLPEANTDTVSIAFAWPTDGAMHSE
jgi:hypothetical protein